MPRNERNNPSARIDRLLFEISELDYWAKSLFDLAASSLSQEDFAKLPPRPVLLEFELETQRRQLTRSKVNAVRDNMRLIRERGHTIREAQTGQPLAKPRAEKFSLAEMEAIVAEAKSNERAEAIEKYQNTLDGIERGDPVAAKLDPKKFTEGL
jgi:hypothetical protein